MKPKDPSLHSVCPTCWAQPGERCEVNNGYVRFESHLERRAHSLTSEEELPAQQPVQVVSEGDIEDELRPGVGIETS
jgi:hypothetical protein